MKACSSISFDVCQESVDQRSKAVVCALKRKKKRGVVG